MGYNVKWVEQESGRSGLFYWGYTPAYYDSLILAILFVDTEQTIGNEWRVRRKRMITFYQVVDAPSGAVEYTTVPKQAESFC